MANWVNAVKRSNSDGSDSVVGRNSDGRSSFSSYNTRNSQNLKIPKHRTDRYKKAFITQLLSNGIINLETYVSCQQ